MAHIIIIGQAKSSLAAKMGTPPTEAQINLDEALDAADEHAHENPNDTEAIAEIEDTAGAAKGYLDVMPVPQDNRLQSYADELNGHIS